MSESTSPPEDVQRQLEEKDHLIQALTERLSEAAEQLDRIRRSGANKSHRAGGTGSSGEMAEQQRSLMEKLSVTIEQWEDVQPRDAFARVEARLDHLRELMEAAVGSGGMSRETAADAPQQTDPAETARDEPSAESQTSAWEAMKAQLLETTAGGESSDQSSTHAPSEGNSPADPQPQPDQPPLSTELTLPTPVDFQTAERRDLEEAIEVRDCYIRYLTERLSREQQRTRENIDWEVLNNAPEELRETLQSMEADLREKLRIAEVDLSLERARLSRVQSRTEELQRQIERRLKKRKKNNPSDAAQKGGADPSLTHDASKGWLSTLGLK